MAAALRRLMGSSELRASLQQRALEGAAYYRVERMAQDHLRLYATLVRRKRPEDPAPVRAA